MEDSFLRFGAQAPLVLQEKPWDVVDLSQKLGDGGEGDKGMDQCLGNGRGHTRELIFFSHHAG